MKCEKCGFEMNKQYLKENHMGTIIPKYCKKCVDKAIEKITDIEKQAKDDYIEQVEWDMIIDCLGEDEKKELNEAHKIAYGEDYPSK